MTNTNQGCRLNCTQLVKRERYITGVIKCVHTQISKLGVLLGSSVIIKINRLPFLTPYLFHFDERVPTSRGPTRGLCRAPTN